MKIIQKSNSLIKSILSTKSLDINNSRFHKFCFFQEIENRLLIFNGITNEIILVNKNISAEETNYLLKNHYYVDSNYDEYKLVDELRNTIKTINQNKGKYINNFTIFTTTDCNARCTYCYQKGISKAYMQESTANDISEYIIKHIDPNHPIRLTWFGGEPLLNPKVINTITNTLNNKNISFTSDLVTNGLLLDEEKMEIYVNNWKLKQVQITLDGYKLEYDKIKNYINNNNSFDSIIKNIKLLIENKIKVVIRLNMTDSNYDNLKILIDYLFSIFKNYNNYGAYISLLYEDELNNNDGLFNKKMDLQNQLYELGIFDNQTDLNITYLNCIADNPNAIVILPNGDISACEHFHKEAKWGSIYNNQAKQDKCLSINNSLVSPLSFWQELMPHDNQCKICPLYFNCTKLKNCPSESYRCNEIQKKEKIRKINWKIKEIYLKNK